MIGKTAEEVFPAEEAVRIEARDNELLRSSQPLFDEREIVTAAGESRMIFSRRITFRDQRDQALYILGVVDDVTERKLAETRIARLAHYDPLTDVPNGTLFREQLMRELSFVRRGAKLAVLCLDLDHFKSINDTLGHQAGDALLKEVAQRIRSCLNEGDLIARLGGDEFAVVRTGLQHPKEAEAFAQQLREIVAGHTYDLKGHQTGSDLSVGIALAPEDGLEIDELLNHADLALYGAKAEGRGSYRYYEPEMNARMKRRRSLEVDLRAALLKNEFVLYYQPILDLETEVIAGCEALLRWQHPQRGMVLPAEFVPVAEETGLINSIGEWVLKQACSDATAWPSSVRVAVNVSPAQFRNSALPLVGVGALAESGLPAHRLELEITESVLMQNNESSLLTLHQLRELGVRIALDDFGTGYSSLSYLRSFPFDRIKIDRSFVADLLDGNEAVAIVHAILSLASSLKMQTTAEGVETAVQQRLLQAAGCDEMQGYLFSQPLPASGIGELIRLRRASAADVACAPRHSVRVEHALIGRHGFPGGGKLIGGRIGRILGGRRAAESEKTSHQQHARFGRGQIGAGDEIVVRVGEAFGAAAADAHNRQAGINCSLQHVLPDRRGHRSIRRQTFGDKPAKPVGAQFFLHQRHEIGRHRWIVEIFLGEIAAVFDD